MNKTTKFSPEVRERAVRMVQEHRGEYPPLWAAVDSIAPKIGCVPQPLLEWVKRQEVEGVYVLASPRPKHSASRISSAKSRSCAAVRVRSSMAIDRAAWQSLERLLLELVPAQSVHARRRQGTDLSVRWLMAQDLMEAYRPIVGTIEFPQPVPRQRLRLRARLCDLARLLSRATLALPDAGQEVCRATVTWASAIDPISTSSASSTPPVQDVLQRLVEFTQYVSIRYSERLAEAGIEPSVGSKGDSYDTQFKLCLSAELT